MGVTRLIAVAGSSSDRFSGEYGLQMAVYLVLSLESGVIVQVSFLQRSQNLSFHVGRINSLIYNECVWTENRTGERGMWGKRGVLERSWS